MSIEQDDADRLGQAAAVSKLYSLAVLDEVTTAVAAFHVQLVAIRQKYLAEFNAGPEQFKLLLHLTDAWNATHPTPKDPR